jgi:PhoH-like ATPase
VTPYTGVKVLEVERSIIDSLYETKVVPLWAEIKDLSENLYVVCKDITGTSSSALAKVERGELVLLDTEIVCQGLRPRNKEQSMAMDALLDDNIKVVTLTGRAGTGKTLLTLAAALDAVEKEKYKRIILTRPMSWVGKHGLGALPGDVDEKFRPYLQNYLCNLEFMLGGNPEAIVDLVEQYRIEFIPIQLIRGASWHNAFIIADEVQTLDYHEMITLGTRVAERSKLVIMGDLGQRDEKIEIEKTGIYKFVNSGPAQRSPLVASLELIKSERSAVSQLFADIFEA